MLGDLDSLVRDLGPALGCRDPGTNRAAYPHCNQEIEAARMEEAIVSDHLSGVKTVVGETAAYRRSLAHILYPGMEVFESGADTRVSDCVGDHMPDSRVPKYQHAAVNDFVVASVDGFRILAREIDLVAHPVDNFLLRGGRQT